MRSKKMNQKMTLLTLVVALGVAVGFAKESHGAAAIS